MKLLLFSVLLIFTNLFSQSNIGLYNLLDVKGKVKSIEINEVTELPGISDGRKIPNVIYDTISIKYYFDKKQNLINAYYGKKAINIANKKNKLSLTFPKTVNRSNWTQSFITKKDTIFFIEKFTRMEGIELHETTKYFFDKLKLISLEKTVLLNENINEIEKCEITKNNLGAEMSKSCNNEDYFRKKTPKLSKILITYTELVYDKKQNWIKRKVFKDAENVSLELRTIEYYK